MGQLRHVLVHVATPLVYADDATADWAEGEPGEAATPAEGPTFPCVLFLPTGQEEANPYRPRKITRPTILFEPSRPDDWDDEPGTAITVSADDELLIGAPELAAWAGSDNARWQIDGAPQPFGPPGRVIGVQATLKAVEG